MPDPTHRRAKGISRRSFLEAGLGAMAGALLSNGLPLSAHSGDREDQYSAGFGYVIRGVRTNARRICITVDDLWSEYYTLKIARECHRRNIRLTFFPIGHAVYNNLERPTEGHKNLYPRLREMGHEFGCHLYTHRVIKEFGVDQLINEEMEPALRVMRRALGANFKPIGIRPPYGHVTEAVKELSQRYYTPLILWGIDSQDAICTQQKDGTIANVRSRPSTNCIFECSAMRRVKRPATKTAARANAQEKSSTVTRAICVPAPLFCTTP